MPTRPRVIDPGGQLMKQTWKARDKRMNVVNELWQNIRFLKFYGWGKTLLITTYSTILTMPLKNTAGATASVKPGRASCVGK